MALFFLYAYRQHSLRIMHRRAYDVVFLSTLIPNLNIHKTLLFSVYLLYLMITVLFIIHDLIIELSKMRIMCAN